MRNRDGNLGIGQRTCDATALFGNAFLGADEAV